MTSGHKITARRMFHGGWSVGEIANATESTMAEVRELLRPELLKRDAERMLASGPPLDWCLPPREWPRVVRANFADVMELVA